MKLYHLPRLMRFFCFGDCIEFPMLSKFVVNSCLKLTTFVTNVIADQDDALCLFNDKDTFPCLIKELTAEDILEVNKHGGVYILNKN
ncbi:putative phosphoprotein phosphatase [Corchorus olitorius]|uniref:Phosphoprotein phosphatase n=1 Tax=Corchorus olitorius TaxID=93759 RepID=A0A1R3JVT0_9ROSI|nr:putative phosphoprotein phosphatase [Corchorus olitorius]